MSIKISESYVTFIYLEKKEKKKKVKVSRNPKQENVMSGVPQGSVIGTSTV